MCVHFCREHALCLEGLPISLCLANSYSSLKAQWNITPCLKSSSTLQPAETLPSFVPPPPKQLYLLPFLFSFDQALRLLNSWAHAISILGFPAPRMGTHPIHDKGIYSKKKLEILGKWPAKSSDGRGERYCYSTWWKNTTQSACWLFLGKPSSFVTKLDFKLSFHTIIGVCHTKLSGSWCLWVFQSYFPRMSFTGPYKLYRLLLFPPGSSFPASLLWLLLLPLLGLPFPMSAPSNPPCTDMGALLRYPLPPEAVLNSGPVLSP